MQIKHPNVVSSVYELVKTVEFDVELDNDSFNLRIELFQSASDQLSFRAHLWRTEFYRIQSTFPQDTETKKPTDWPSDELIFVDFSHYLSRDYSAFQAESQDAALQLIFDNCKEFLTRATLISK